MSEQLHFQMSYNELQNQDFSNFAASKSERQFFNDQFFNEQLNFNQNEELPFQSIFSGAQPIVMYQDEKNIKQQQLEIFQKDQKVLVKHKQHLKNQKAPGYKSSLKQTKSLHKKAWNDQVTNAQIVNKEWNSTSQSGLFDPNIRKREINIYGSQKEKLLDRPAPKIQKNNKDNFQSFQTLDEIEKIIHQRGENDQIRKLFNSRKKDLQKMESILQKEINQKKVVQQDFHSQYEQLAQQLKQEKEANLKIQKVKQAKLDRTLTKIPDHKVLTSDPYIHQTQDIKYVDSNTLKKSISDAKMKIQQQYDEVDQIPTRENGQRPQKYQDVLYRYKY